MRARICPRHPLPSCAAAAGGLTVQDAHFTPFGYLTAPNAPLYRHVMGTFVQAKRRFTVHLRPEDIQQTLGSKIGLPTIVDALGRLVEWGNLRADPDTSRVTTVEDFHRARFLYQLTQRGEAVEQAVQTYDEALGRRGALQAVALADIATQLRALAELAGHTDADHAKVHLLLRGLVDRFTDLAANAQAFMSSLQRTIDLHDADADVFRAYKDRLVHHPSAVHQGPGRHRVRDRGAGRSGRRLRRVATAGHRRPAGGGGCRTRTDG